METKVMRPLIYCVGDSHVSFFSGVNLIQPLYPEKSVDYYPFFKTARLGPVLAYNLCKAGTQSQGREKLFAFLRERRASDLILLSFGEIDCRAHLVKQSYRQKRSIDSIVDECVERYFSVISEIRMMGFELLIWNAIPSTTALTIPDIKDPVFGTCLERNQAAKLFNDYLCQCSGIPGIKFVSIFDKLIDNNGMTKMEYYLDEVHLSQKAMPLVLADMKKILPEMDFQVSPLAHVKRESLILARRVISKARRTLGAE